MNKHRIFLAVTLVECLVLGLFILSSHRVVKNKNERGVPAKRRMVQALELTDLAIWTEARYTRHPSQADFFTPFQDFPSAFEHFPAGSILAPGRMADVTTTLQTRR